MGKRRVEVNRLNFDVCAFTDVAEGRGFFITDPPEVDIDETRKKALNGPQSPRFGTTFSDEQAFAERYSCDCGAFTGVAFKDEICPKCGQKVEFKDVNPKMTGWIPFGNKKIVAPHYYRILQAAIGKDEFPEIIYTKKKVDRDGRRVDLTTEEMKEFDPKSPFCGIGLESFRFRFDEVLDFYRKKKPNKASTFDLISKERLKVFTSYAPVYTTLLRQQSVTSENFYFTGIDKDINTLTNLARNLRDSEDIETPVILGRIQQRVNAIWEFNFNLINSKDGLIRDQLIGGSLNFTSRNVICPDPSLKDNEIDLGYSCFYVMFKFKIIYYLMKMYGISLAAANTIWEQGYDFDQRIYEIMLMIINIEHPSVVINRNPTLNYYSIILMDIRTIRPDKGCLTLMVPLSILSGLNADELSHCRCIVVILYRASRERLTSGVSYNIAC
jgi:hypothetical protein